MFFHHWMYWGCQCSSARCSRLLLERPTLLGIFSAEIMMGLVSELSGIRLQLSAPFRLKAEATASRHQASAVRLQLSDFSSQHPIADGCLIPSCNRTRAGPVSRTRSARLSH